MVTYSKYGRQASSREVGKMRVDTTDAERTTNKSHVVPNSYGLSETDFNRGIAVYKLARIGLASNETMNIYISWLKKNVVNFNLDSFTTGIAFAKRYFSINKSVKNIEYNGNFDEDNFFNEWNTVMREGKKNGRR